MEASVGVAELEDVLQCRICMKTFVNPKVLACSHQFCKECLDDRLEFNDDGGVTLICPNGCEERTTLTANETTNDLRVSFEVHRILDILQTGKQTVEVPNSPCCDSPNCERDVAAYCCGSFRCEPCTIEHDKTQQKHERVDVLFDKTKNKLKALCQLHSTSCTHLSADDRFLCIYCLNRSHKDLVKYTIEEQSGKTRETLSNDFANIGHLKKLQKATEESLQKSKSYLDRTIQERKLVCLSSYLEVLNREEKTIREHYQKVLDEHLEKYSATISDDDLCLLHDNIEKNDIQLTIEKKTIIVEPSQCNLANATIQPVNVSLSENFGIDCSHPLGELKVSLEQEILFSDISDPTFKYNAIELNELVRLVEEIKKIERCCNTCMWLLDQDYTRSAEKLIREKDGDKLTLLLSQRKRIANRRRWNNKTLLHSASVCNNVEALETLIKCGASVDARSTGGHTVLDTAVWTNSVDCVMWLLRQHPTLMNVKQNNGWTPLHRAAHDGNLTCVKALIEHGANLQDTDNQGRTPWQLAQQRNNLECMKELVCEDVKCKLEISQ